MPLLRPPGHRELRLLAVVLTTVALLWLGAAITDAVLDGDTHALDEAAVRALRNPADPADPLGPPWVEEAARDVTALGGVPILSLLTLAVLGALVLRRRTRTAVLLLASVVGALAINQALKVTFGRPRPELVPHEAQVYTASFPSGHAMLSAATYLTIAALLSRVEPRWRVRGWLLAVAVLLTALVGASRVYLGVHYPTDVLAGWTFGALWALLVLAVADAIRPGER